MNTNAFADLFKTPDMNKLFDAQRRNIEALSGAVQAGMEGAQEISRRGAAAIRDNVEQGLKATRELMGAGTPEAGLAKQSEVTRKLFEASVVNLREVTELLTKTGFEAFDVLNRRASEALHEVQGTPASKRK